MDGNNFYCLLGYKNATDADLVAKMIQSVPNDLLEKVLKKLKQDYEIFNYPIWKYSEET